MLSPLSTMAPTLFLFRPAWSCSGRPVSVLIPGSLRSLSRWYRASCPQLAGEVAEGRDVAVDFIIGVLHGEGPLVVGDLAGAGCRG